MNLALADAVKWTDWVSAVALAGTAVVLAVAATAALLQWRATLRQLDESREASHARWAIDVHREWDEQLALVRHLVRQHGPTPDALRDKMRDLWTNNDREYYECLREPAYWDRVAVLLERGEISGDTLRELIGPDAFYRWELWKPTIDTFMRNELKFGDAFDQFQRLGEQSREYIDKAKYACDLVEHDKEYSGPR